MKTDVVNLVFDLMLKEHQQEAKKLFGRLDRITADYSGRNTLRSSMARDAMLAEGEKALRSNGEIAAQKLVESIDTLNLSFAAPLADYFNEILNRVYPGIIDELEKFLYLTGDKNLSKLELAREEISREQAPILRLVQRQLLKSHSGIGSFDSQILGWVYDRYNADGAWPEVGICEAEFYEQTDRLNWLKKELFFQDAWNGTRLTVKGLTQLTDALDDLILISKVLDGLEALIRGPKGTGGHFTVAELEAVTSISEKLCQRGLSLLYLYPILRDQTGNWTEEKAEEFSVNVAKLREGRTVEAIIERFDKRASSNQPPAKSDDAIGAHTDKLKKVAILTALPVECSAVKEHLKNTQERQDQQDGTLYDVGSFNGTNHNYDVLTAEVGAGNPSAAGATMRIIKDFKPEILMFVGIAGGLKDVKIGDVVVGTKIYGYERGKAGSKTSSKFQTRPELGHSSHWILQRARKDAKEQSWKHRVLGESATLAVVVAPIAAAEKVLGSAKSPLVKFLRTNFTDAVAVDMESLGFTQTAMTQPTVQYLVVRGISDLIEGKEEADASGTQKLASAHAAAFAFEVLANLNLNSAGSTDHEVASLKQNVT